jgi:hypothetical protein
MPQVTLLPSRHAAIHPHVCRRNLGRLLGIAAAMVVGAAVGCSPDGDNNNQQGFASNPNDTAGTGGSGPVDPPPPPGDDGGSGGTGGTGGGIGSGSGCQAGHYVGGFEGTYRSPADPGASVFQFDLVIMSFENIFDMFDYGLELWLEEADGGGDDCSLGTEFCADYVVSGGKIRGTANAYLLVNAPFEIDLTGELDCSQGQFRGLLQNGWYEVFGERYPFSGTIEATYDQGTFSFTNGSWAVEEEDPAPNPPPAGWGGEGTWQASLNQ